MSVSISNESKNNLSITNQGKTPTGSEITWDQATFTWDDADGATWDVVGLVVPKESKNTAITLTNESKN